MPLTAKLTGVLVSWELYKFPEGAPYAFEAAVTWASVEAREAALATDDGKRCIEDVKHYTKTRPVTMLRHEVASG